jgi:hypothetical protein
VDTENTRILCKRAPVAFVLGTPFFLTRLIEPSTEKSPTVSIAKMENFPIQERVLVPSVQWVDTTKKPWWEKKSKRNASTAQLAI